MLVVVILRHQNDPPPHSTNSNKTAAASSNRSFGTSILIRIVTRDSWTYHFKSEVEIPRAARSADEWVEAAQIRAESLHDQEPSGWKVLNLTHGGLSYPAIDIQHNNQMTIDHGPHTRGN